MAKEIILLVGAPGSGKSSFAKSISTHAYINQDEMGKEQHFRIFESHLENGFSIIVDRMNFSKEQRERYLAPARAQGYKTKIIVFHVPSETCMIRCINRNNHPTIKTPADASRAINFFFSKYERVEDNEADEVVRLGWDGDREPALIFDLDGTMANIDARMHFLEGKVADSEETQKKDWKKFFEHIPTDKVNNWCAELLWKFEDSHTIVFCSGRPDNYKKSTEEWLKNNNLSYNNLFMRRRGDYRKDEIVKQIILDFELLPRYDILFVVDDRRQVVDMWRRNDIVCLHCAEGNY